METELRGGETECLLSSARSRDLLLRFSGGFFPDDVEEANGSDSDEIELGLSLGGCFNSASSHKNRILRTSSIPAILPCEVSPLYPLFRTCSLPEEEMQNKKRKGEVMRTFRRVGERVEEKLEEDPVLKLKRVEVENKGSWIRGSGPASRLYSPLTSCITGAGLPSTLRNGITPATQGSAVSEGSNSSGGSESESRSGQGFELSGFSHNDHKSPPFSPFSKPLNGAAISNGTVSHATLLRNNNGGRCINGSGEQSKGTNKKMPLVSTKGDGPDGVRLNGLLYTYGSGEEVRIVCVCHGKFLTPSEFVKHAGGGDVAHPLRHIVVSTNTAFF